MSRGGALSLPPHFSVRPLARSDFEVVTRLVLDRNRHPESQCIHCDAGESTIELIQEMERLDENGEIRGVVARRDGECVGFLGAEVDVEGRRGWLRGPLLLLEDSTWEAAALRLWHEFEPVLPAAIGRLDAFPNTANRRAQEFYSKLGFHRVRMIHAYTAYSGKEIPASGTPAEILSPQHHESFVALHDENFPDTLEGKRILTFLDEDHRVFVRTEGDDLLGYLYATSEEGDEEGTVEYVAVRKEARGRGIGLDLLQAALRWFFQDRGLPRAGLVVNEELVNAQALYERAGFEHKYTGVHLRKNR